MDYSRLIKKSDYEWILEPKESMRVPAHFFGSEKLIQQLDPKVEEQLMHVASLPGIVEGAYAMPDAHWGYGFPIGGVAAFDQDGIVSAGGVGFDISCGVRTFLTCISFDEFQKKKDRLADVLYETIPAGVGRGGTLSLSPSEMDEILVQGAKWAINRGYGEEEDLKRTEFFGTVPGANPKEVSFQAKKRQLNEMGSLGSGNHYLEVQAVQEVFDERIAEGFHLKKDDIVVSIHSGSRGLGHQVATDYVHLMAKELEEKGISLLDRDLAYAPIKSVLGASYLQAMRAAMNLAICNRQILLHLARSAFKKVFSRTSLPLLFDVSHNTCREEEHILHGKKKQLFVHRKGATPSFGPDHPFVPNIYKPYGQPVLIGGSMGTPSYILAGCKESEGLAFSSSCHGAGRQMSRTEATKKWSGREIIDELKSKGIIIRSHSYRGVAEEAPGAYKNVSEVVESCHQAHLSKKVAKVRPLVSIKG